MRTLTKKIAESLENSDRVIERLICAVVAQGLDPASFSDVANYGIDGGFSGFTYYVDTCQFYKDNKEDIWDYATDQADELGYKNVFEMIAGFRRADIGGVDQFENLMAWYTAEEVARYCMDNYKLPEYS